ncbi:MAG: hypothetical protein HC900_04830, partial [Methylacidiphilales bacterium]|nr:hypothetical protein [Candidatus Methylacidiphilales bacterium]
MQVRKVTVLAFALAVGAAGSAVAQSAPKIDVVPPLPLHKAVFAFATLPVKTGLPGDVAAAGVLPL